MFLYNTKKTKNTSQSTSSLLLLCSATACRVLTSDSGQWEGWVGGESERRQREWEERRECDRGRKRVRNGGDTENMGGREGVEGIFVFSHFLKKKGGSGKRR